VPLHRSLTLWLGLPGLLFLLWAWLDSMSFESGISIRKHSVSPNLESLSRDSYFSSNSALTFVVGHLHHRGSVRTDHNIIVLPRTSSRGEVWWPTPGCHRDYDPATGYTSRWLRIPHWLLVLLYLLLWSLAFGWRHRRIKRHSITPGKLHSDLDIGT
jgi:hypothetical protein